MEIRLHALRCKRDSDDRFRKPTFFDARKRRLRVDERLKRRKKIFVFKNIGTRAFLSKFLRGFLQ